MIFLVIAAAFFACFFAASIVSSYLRARKAKGPVDGLPVVPNAHAIFGHFGIFRRGLNSGDFESVQRTLCYDHANSDGISTFWILGNPWMSVTDPQLVRKVLTIAHDRRPTPIQAKHGSMFLGRRNLGSLRGKEWRYWRSAVHRAFTPAALDGLRRPMMDVAWTLVTSLKGRIANQTPESAGGDITMDVEPLMKMVTMDTFGRTALGLDFACCSALAPSPVALAFDDLSDQLIHRFRTFYLPTSHYYWLPMEANRRHREESALIRGILDEAVRSRRGEERQRPQTDINTGDDLLSHLLRAVDADAKKQGNESGSVDLLEETFSDMLMTLLFAGYETTSITLTYALHCLATHPDVEARLVEEVNSVLGSSSRPPSSSESMPPLDPEQLPYCRAVIMETLRLYPPAIQTVRGLESEMEIGGCRVPEGTSILIPIWCIQRDEHYFPKPQAFIPERWVYHDGQDKGGWHDRCSDDEKVGEGAIPAANRDAFLAFSGGARSCVGRKFAMQEAVTILAVLIRDLKFESTDGYELEPFRSGIVQQPLGGIPMKITMRN